MFRKYYDRFLALSRIKQVLFGISAFVVLVAFFLIFLRLLVSLEIIDKLPSKLEIKQIQNPIGSELYSAEEKLIGRYYIENRGKLEWDDLNEFYKNALIATEDVRFYNHKGVDNRSLVRVALKSILLFDKSSGGGSTITQQLAKNLFPRKRYSLFSTLINKFREFSIARRIEQVYTKEEILLLYSNTVSFGERAFGLHTASKRFFNKEPKDLLLEEAALLVGMLKATSYYNPRRNPDNAKRRRNVVLSQMFKYDYISEQVKNDLSSLEVKLNYQELSQEEEFARYFKQQVLKEFKTWAADESKPDGSKYNVYTDGLKIYSTLDYDMQIVAELYMTSHMKRLQKLFLDSWENGKLFGEDTKIIDDQILAHRDYRALRKAGKGGKAALQEFNNRERRHFWSWDGYLSDDYTRIDSIKHYLSLLHAGVLAADPSSGKIKVWVGGNDYGFFQFDNITAARQMGSVFKPIVYLTALEQGIGSCDYYKNEKRQYTSYKDWTPGNADGKYGGYMPVWRALSQSVNTVSVQVLFDVGIPKVVNMAAELGIESQLSAVPSIVLGTSDVSLYEMVQAYTTIANQGDKIKLRGIQRIEDTDGNILYEYEQEMDPEMADIAPESFQALNEMLSKVTSEGTGRRLYRQFDIPFEVKGKTGTTQNQSDGWFIGYTDKLIVGSWVGTQDRRIHFRTLATGSGGRTALPLAGAVFEYAASKGLTGPVKEEFTYICPDSLSDDRYDYLQKQVEKYEYESDSEYFAERGDRFERRSIFDDPFSKYRRSVDRDKKSREAEYQRELKKWERRLEELFGKKKSTKKRRRNNRND